MKNSFPDRILIEARDASLQLEQLAVNDLASNLDGYLEPNFKSRQMVRDWQAYINAGGYMTEEQYRIFRSAFTETKGRSNKVFSDTLARHIRPANQDLAATMFKSILTQQEDENVSAMVTGEEDDTSEGLMRLVNSGARALENNGWWKLPALAPDSLVNSLKTRLDKQMIAEHGDNVQAAYEGNDDAPMQIKVNSGHCSMYEEMLDLASDPLLLAIVQQYMGVPPIFNTPVAFLNSFVKAKNEKALSNTAQLYHHDMHRLQFVKMFIYLTDVVETSGPHTLIQGTHRRRPDALWEDGRHTDATVARHGMLKDEIRINGQAGTIFLVDTSCLHKGSHPEKESRLMAQMQYVNSLFGKPIAPSDHRVERAQKSKNETLQFGASLSRKYAEKAGTRFMQNYI